MTAEGLAIRPAGAEPHQLAAYSTLLSAVFGRASKFEPDAIGWRYRDNPLGRVVGADAWSGDTLVAHYVTSPTTARLEGRPVLGLLSLNTATHKAFRGGGLFTRLAEDTYAQGREAGFAFVIGVANANSTPGMVRKLAFQHVARLQAGFLVKAPRRFDVRALQFEGDWSDDLMRWRLANPAARYSIARRGELGGVWARTHVPGIGCVAFLESRPDLRGRRPPPGISMFLGLEPRIDLKELGFVGIPDRFRPSPLNLIWRSLDDRAPARLDPGSVALNFLDFDPY